MDVRGLGKCLYCRSGDLQEERETCTKRVAALLWGVPLPPATGGHLGVGWGAARALQPRWRCQQEVWGQWEVQAEVWARLARPGVWHQHPLAPSLLPSLSHCN